MKQNEKIPRPLRIVDYNSNIENQKVQFQKWLDIVVGEHIKYRGYPSIKQEYTDKEYFEIY